MTKFFSLLMLVNGIAPIISPVAGGQLMKWTTWNGVFSSSAFWPADDLSVIFGVKESLSPETVRQADSKRRLYHLEGSSASVHLWDTPWRKG
ncbi:hypothetical protein PO124_15275 [Bacillus licheniformis]|nr:hypothetical protein [Bacillus licheniformis]